MFGKNSQIISFFSLRAYLKAIARLLNEDVDQVYKGLSDILAHFCDDL